MTSIETNLAEKNREAIPSVDRRKFQRVAHALPARVIHLMKSGHRFQFEARTRDISIGGLGLVLAHDAFGQVTLGCQALVTIDRAGFHRAIKLEGVVARSAVMDDASCHIGIQFSSPRYNILSTLADHLRVTVVVSPRVQR